MRSIEPLDAVSGQVTAWAGVTLAQLQDRLVGSGWDFAVDLGARGSATIGGMAATNAGGMRVLAHGMMRRQVVGIEAVLADGSIVGSLSGLVKDNTGYDLAGLLCGSEGTLAVITRVRLALVPAAPERLTALVAAEGMDDAVRFAAMVRRQVPSVDALEFVTAEGVALAAETLGVRSPIVAAVVVLVELAGAGDLADPLAAVVGERDCAVASDAVGRAALWAVRERQAEAINHLGPPHKLDVTLPLSALAQFCDAVGDAVSLAAGDDANAVRVHLFGHLGDGNVHVNVSGVHPDDELVDEAVLRLVVAHGGSISAEHGIGRAKRKWLHLQRSNAEIAAMRAVKQALDPAGIMNPGVLF
jgi:FAD/FMN-containing dehydrogenase